MNIYKADSYEELSRIAADDLIMALSAVTSPLVCTASGDSPAGLYRELARRVNQHELDVSGWKFVGLDEWCGMNGEDEGSCRYHLDKQLYHPLQIKNAQLCFFNGRAQDPDAECMRTEAYIEANGGIDIAIVGLGLNGHIGMNEPGTAANSRSHRADIAWQTQQVGQKYFTGKRSLTHGLTLGIDTLMEARHIFLIVTGAHKAGIVKNILTENVSEQIPATLFREHEGLHIYLDKAAAQLI